MGNKSLIALACSTDKMDYVLANIKMDAPPELITEEDAAGVCIAYWIFDYYLDVTDLYALDSTNFPISWKFVSIDYSSGNVDEASFIVNEDHARLEEMFYTYIDIGVNNGN